MDRLRIANDASFPYRAMWGRRAHPDISPACMARVRPLYERLVVSVSHLITIDCGKQTVDGG